jgi:DNA gyrase/topoisomerase IV subunit B
MTIDPFGESFAENLFTKLYACRDSKRSAHLKGRCCGVGIAVVNALCNRFRVQNCRDGICWVQEYRCGTSRGPFLKAFDTEESGVEINFEPDRTIFTNLQFNPPGLIRWIMSTGVGLTVVRTRRRKGDTETKLEFVVK